MTMAANKQRDGRNTYFLHSSLPLSEEERHIFVTYTTAPKLAAQTPAVREIVRRRATKAYHESGNAKFVNSIQREHLMQATKLNLRESTHRFRIKGASQIPSNGTSREATDHGERSPDPSQLPLLSHHLPALEPYVNKLGPQAWEILHHYRYYLRQNSMIFSTMKEKFSFIIEDAATTHAFLSLVSLNRDFIQGNTMSAATLFHRSKAIKSIREKLDNGPSEGKREIVAGTIALLIIAESLEGNCSICSVHLSGMMTIVIQAGGIELLTKNKVLSHLLAWSGISYSSTWPCPNRLPEILEFLMDRKLCNYDLESQISYTAFRPALSDILSSDLIEVVDVLHTLPNFPPPENAPSSEHQRVATAVYTIERKLIAYRVDNSASPLLCVFSSVFRSAALLYASVALRDVPIKAKLVSTLSEMLIDGIQQIQQVQSLTRMNGLPKAWQIILLWASVVQLVAVPEVDRFSIPVSVILGILKNLGISSADTLVAVLRQIAWVQDFLSSSIAKLVAFNL